MIDRTMRGLVARHHTVCRVSIVDRYNRCKSVGRIVLIVRIIEAVVIAVCIFITGNKILDTVLYQKKLYCDSRGIRLDWSARGESLSFFEPSKLYALLSNALENAVEAVMPLEENRRIISFNVLENTDGVTVEVANYFDPGSSPVCGTSKPDKAHHGFGLKSMRFIADEYGGSVETAIEDDMFFLTVYLRH